MGTRSGNSFASAGGFKSLLVARFISSTGDVIALITLVFYVSATRGKGTAVAALLLAVSLPWLFGPLVGGLADRVDKRRLMVACEALQATIFLIIAITLPPFPILLALVALSALLSVTFWPSARSAVPALLDVEQLSRGNAMMGLVRNLSIAAGPAIGGLLITTFEVEGALAVNAGTFVISSLLLTRLPALPRGVSDETPESLLRSVRSGFSLMTRHATARAVALGALLGLSFAALDNVALPFLAIQELDTGARGFGLLSSGYGVGMLVTSLVMLRWGHRKPDHWLLAGFGMLGIGTLMTGLAPALLPAIAAQFLAGGGNGIENISIDTLIQTTVPEEYLGRVFGSIAAAYTVAEGVAYGAGGFLLDIAGPRKTFVIAGCGVLLTMLIVRVLLPKDPVPATSAPHQLNVPV